MMRVAMSAMSGLASASRQVRMRSSGRPARPKTTGVVPGSTAVRHLKARPSCQGRALEIGL